MSITKKASLIQRKKGAAALPVFYLSGPPTAPLLGQLDHRERFVLSRIDGRLEECMLGSLPSCSCTSASTSPFYGQPYFFFVREVWLRLIA